MMMRWVGMIVVPLSLACAMLEFAPQEGSAAIVEIAVSGRSGVYDPLGLPRDWIGLLLDSIPTGAPWSGVIRYHTDLPDEDPDPKHAHYFDQTRPDALLISVNVHGHIFAGGKGELQADVLNDIIIGPGQSINF